MVYPQCSSNSDAINMPLASLRVLDLGQVWAAPLATRHLADMGAEVIKVESHVRPDGRGNPLPDNIQDEDWVDLGGAYNELHRSKKSITLNLLTPEGVNTCKELVKVSDVVVENYSPRVMKNFGLDYEVLRQIKPDIIMISASGYGHSGPWANFGAYGNSLEPMCGFAAVTGYSDGVPRRSGIAYTDPTGAPIICFALLAALNYRRRTGKGQWIDLSQYEFGVTLMAEPFIDYSMNKRIWEQIGNRSRSGAIQGCYQAKGNDKWVVITISSDAEWSALCKALGDPLWTKDEGFSDILSRYKNHDEIDTHIAEWTEDREPYEIMDVLQGAGVTAGVVLTNKQMLTDRHLKERDFYMEIKRPESPLFGTRLLPGVAWKMSKTPGKFRWNAPKLGQFNKEVICDILGMTQEELDALEEKDVIGYQPKEGSLQPPRIVPLDELKNRGRIEEYDEDYREILTGR